MPLGFAAAVVVLALARPTPATVGAGAAVAVLGEAIRIWAAGHLNKSREVTSSGPYRWTAHPLYVGSAVMGAGLAIAAASVAAALLIGIYLAATLTAAIDREERDLRRAFGDAYDRYRRGEAIAERDRSRLAVGDVRRFSVAQAMANREHRAVIGLAVVVLLLAWKATYNGAFWRSAGTRASGRAVSSVVEHRLYTPAVTGSNPVPPRTRRTRLGELAVETDHEFASHQFESPTPVFALLGS